MKNLLRIVLNFLDQSAWVFILVGGFFLGLIILFSLFG